METAAMQQGAGLAGVAGQGMPPGQQGAPEPPMTWGSLSSIMGTSNGTLTASDDEEQIWAMLRSDPKLDKLIEGGKKEKDIFSSLAEGIASNLSGTEGSKLQSVAKDLETARRMDAEADTLEKKAAELRAEAARTARVARAAAETAAAQAVEAKVKELVMQADKLDVQEKDVEVLSAKLTAKSRVELHQANEYMQAADVALNASALNETVEESLLATARW